MAFFDFLKRKKEIEKVSLEELESWVRKKKIQVDTQERDFLGIIKNKIFQLIKELEEEIFILKKIDLDERKEENRIKFIVMENLGNYISNIRIIMQKLENFRDLEGYNIENLKTELSAIFFNFEKTSRMSYEKATILIGKELAGTKRSLNNFSYEFESFLKKNKNLVQESKILIFIEEEIREKNKIQKIKFENENKKQQIEEKIKESEKEKEIIEKQIKRIKNTEEYFERIKKREEIKTNLNEIDKEKNILKKVIDYKFLAKNFHDNKEKMKIIKEYKEKFDDIFLEDQGEKIINLLNESGANSEIVSEKVKKIIQKQKEVKNMVIKEDEIKGLKFQIEKINLQIKELDHKNLGIIKKCNKLEIKIREIINLISKELIKIGVEVSDFDNL